MIYMKKTTNTNETVEIKKEKTIERENISLLLLQTHDKIRRF